MSKAKVPVLYSGFKSYVRFLTEKIYYRKVYYLNTENVPEDGTPLLVVSDHQNSLNDALGILMSIRDRVVHVIVRADVFALSPIADKFLRSIGLLPAFRLNWEGEAALKNNGAQVFNIGTGTPYSVLEIVNAFEEANGIKVSHEFGPRRIGDLPECWADAGKAERVLGWKAERGLVKMCRDTWNWQKNNPEGYR